jgi:hypothetical protein
VGKGNRCVRLTTLPPSRVVVMKSGNLNFLEPCGPLQACNGTAAVPFYCFMSSIYPVRCHFVRHCPLPSKKLNGCRAHSVLIQTYVCTATITLKWRTELWAFSDLHHVWRTFGTINLGNSELIRLNWGSYLVHLADPTVMRLAYKISRREFQCKPQNIGPCKYRAFDAEFLCVFYIQASYQLIAFKLTLVFNGDIP